jgi:hypothetical protein
MAVYYELPIYKSLHSLVLVLIKQAKNLPKDYKYGLGQPLIHDTMEMLRKLFRVNSVPDKEQFIREFIDAAELVRAELRIMKDLRCMSVETISELQPKLEGIMKQAYGWLRSVAPDAVVYGYVQSQD